jgi:hypothetical protein
MVDRPLTKSAVILLAALALAILFAVLDRRAEQPAIDPAELTGWFKLEGRN